MSKHDSAGIWGGSYFLGFIGALVYYMQMANSFWLVIGGFFKALVWPAFLIYSLFNYLHVW